MSKTRIQLEHIETWNATVISPLPSMYINIYESLSNSVHKEMFISKKKKLDVLVKYVYIKKKKTPYTTKKSSTSLF